MAEKLVSSSLGNLVPNMRAINLRSIDIFRPQVMLSLGISYLFLVRLLRYRLLEKNNSEIQHNSELSSMTSAKAQRIMRRIAGQDFPFTFKIALQFALFRTYGIPSISRLLVDTSLFSEPASASKRYADTSVLVAEMIARDIGSEEWIQGLARLNCIHGKYITSGRIKNDDLLYTLALFAREPCRWIEKNEWRKLSDVEKCALGVFWKHVGDMMKIEMKGLPTFDRGEKWRDGLQWFEELDQWADNYEARYMVLDSTNVKVREQTIAILLWNIPQRFHSLGKSIVGALMDKRLRQAMDYPDPPTDIVHYIYRAISCRKMLIRYLALPRPWAFRYRSITDQKSASGTYHMTVYDSLPYYVKPGILNRWGPGALVRRVRGLPIPGDDGDKYMPDGYVVTEVGPNHGRLGQAKMEDAITPIGRRTCPMAFGT